ncbi:MAG: hypothetical protein KGQ77_07540, partial [Betaproteobacteria bacterium]|nr:hypothetical protein [Betaproteobacteria bacterium]
AQSWRAVDRPAGRSPTVLKLRVKSAQNALQDARLAACHAGLKIANRSVQVLQCMNVGQPYFCKQLLTGF